VEEFDGVRRKNCSHPQRIGIKAGCFTILHAGHVHALEYARDRCDRLIVLTSVDNRIRSKKGCVPISLEDRMRILGALRCVDEIHSFSEYTEKLWVMKFKKDRMYQEFGEDAKLVMFHTPEVYDNPPCRMIADELIFIPKIRSSVTAIFETIDGRSRG